MTWKLYSWVFIPEKKKLYSHTHLYTNVHSSLVTKNWKLPRCLSPGEWLDKLWYIYTMEYCCLVAKSLSVRLFCDPMDCSPPGSSVHETFQARYWSGLPFPSPGDLPKPGIEPTSPALAGRFLITEPPRKPTKEYYSPMKKEHQNNLTQCPENYAQWEKKT